MVEGSFHLKLVKINEAIICSNPIVSGKITIHLSSELMGGHYTPYMRFINEQIKLL
jgi:hypothetical protein